MKSTVAYLFLANTSSTFTRLHCILQVIGDEHSLLVASDAAPQTVVVNNTITIQLAGRSSYGCQLHFCVVSPPARGLIRFDAESGTVEYHACDVGDDTFSFVVVDKVFILTPAPV